MASRNGMHQDAAGAVSPWTPTRRVAGCLGHTTQVAQQSRAFPLASWRSR
jgi:hypothetical protein